MATYTIRDNKRIQVKIRLNGVSDSKTFDKNCKVEARKWATEREHEIMAGYMSRIPNKTFGDLLQKYMDEELGENRRSDRNRLRRTIRVEPIAKVSLRDLDATHVASWRRARLAKVKSSSVLREWNILSPACTVAIKEWRWLHKNPFAGVERPEAPPPRYRRISPQEIETMRFVSGFDAGKDTATARVCAAWLFAIETMMRIGEICALTPEDIDMTNHFARVTGVVPGAKKTSNAVRSVPLSDEAERLLSLVGGSFGLTTQQADALFRKTTKKAGIDNLHFHDSRHEAITRNSKYMDVLALAKAAGIADLKTLKDVYYNPTAEEIAADFRARRGDAVGQLDKNSQ